jgi:hypothetical protein
MHKIPCPPDTSKQKNSSISLTEEQAHIVKEFADHLINKRDHEPNECMHSSLQGQAGTGKTATIRALEELYENHYHITDMQSQPTIDDDVFTNVKDTSMEWIHPTHTLKMAFFGIAARNLGGLTIHDAFSFRTMNFNTEYKPVAVSTRHALQRRFGHVKLIVIDEFSVLPSAFLFHIEQRCHEIWPGHSQQMFAGRDILLVGDFAQLPPINPRTSLCYQPTQQDKADFHTLGRTIFDQMPHSFILTKNMRLLAEDDDPDTELWDSLLQRLRTGEVTQRDVAILNSRYHTQEQIQNLQSLIITPTNKASDRNNAFKITSMPGETFHLKSRFEIPLQKQNAVQFARDFTDHHYSHKNSFPFRLDLPLKHKVQIISTTNMCIKYGLSKGSLGHVVSVVFPEEAQPSNDVMNAKDLPVILVSFDDYTGPSFLPHIQRCVPICATALPVRHNQVSFKLHTWSIKVGFSLTVHAVQGITLDSVIVDCREHNFFAYNMAYVAFSRVRSLQHLILLRKISSPSELMSDNKFACMVKNKIDKLTQKARQTKDKS